MGLFRVTDNRLESVPETSFPEEQILERKDLQRLLKADISVLGDHLLVIAEEFGDWEESNRRIDLLCLDTQARLVVVEVKRTEGGAHMELQAIRYAAMVSSMTLDQAIAAYARLLGGDDSEGRAKREVLEFLELDSAEDEELTDEVRILLVSASFSPELTTSVIWLNKHGLDISCIRLKPYKMEGDVLIDATQIVPLPEAEDYEVKVRAQVQESKKVRTVRQEIFRRFWSQLIERSRAKTELFSNRSTTTDQWLSAGIGRSGVWLNLSLTESRGRVECYIRLGKNSEQRNKLAFKELLAQREEIESAFEDSLDWQELPNRIGSRICTDLVGGWRTPESDWAALQDQLIGKAILLEKALRDPIQRLNV